MWKMKRIMASGAGVGYVWLCPHQPQRAVPHLPPPQQQGLSAVGGQDTAHEGPLKYTTGQTPPLSLSPTNWRPLSSAMRK